MLINCLVVCGAMEVTELRTIAVGYAWWIYGSSNLRGYIAGAVPSALEGRILSILEVEQEGPLAARELSSLSSLSGI